VTTPFQYIDYRKEGLLALIFFNRPPVRNAYNTVMRDDLYQVLNAVRDDPEVRAIVLAGRGPDFCAGADLTEFGTAPSMPIARRVRWERDLWGLFLGLDKPLVAAIQGHCIGSGLEMALLCDLRIAAEDATFAMPEVRLGLIAAAGGTQTLPRTLGPGRALEMLMTGREVKAQEALEWGLVTRVVPTQRLEEKTREVATRLALLDPAAMAALKIALSHGPDLSLAQALELEDRLAQRLLQASPS
jgi:enoyl-CoA hydratase/carnithine racemase